MRTTTTTTITTFPKYPTWSQAWDLAPLVLESWEMDTIIRLRMTAKDRACGLATEALAYAARGWPEPARARLEEARVAHRQDGPLA